VNDSSEDLGTTRGSWWIAMAVIFAIVVAVLVVLVLVDRGELSKGWAYAVVPVAIIAAASTRVLTIFKAAAESKRQSPPPPRP
jgi:Sec-independent protein secretion pathway component TatC